MCPAPCRGGGTAIPESLAITGSLSERALLGEAVTLSALLSLQDVPGVSAVATGEGFDSSPFESRSIKPVS